MNDFKIEGSKEIAKSMLEDVPEYNSNGILPASTVRRYLRKTLQGRTIYNNSIKKNVEVSSTTIGKVFSIPAIRKSLRNGFSKNQHIEAALNLEKLFKSAVLKERNKDKNGSPDIVEVDRLDSDFFFNGDVDIFTARFTVFEHKQENQKPLLYSLELTSIEKKDKALANSGKSNIVELIHAKGFTNSVSQGILEVNISNTQEDETFNELITSLKEAIAIERGEMAPSRVTVYEINDKEIRRELCINHKQSDML